MMITVNKCKNYDAARKWQKRKEAEIYDNDQPFIEFEAPPMCIGCVNNSINGGLPCAVSFNPNEYMVGRYCRRNDLAARRICKRIARMNRRAEWLRKYRIRQDFFRILRKYLKNEQEEGTK